MKREMEQVTSRRLIIHMGVQKTASTAFQNFANRNRAALGQYLNVMTPGKGSDTRLFGRLGAQFSLDTSLEGDFRQAATRMRDHVLASEAPCLISHENLPGAMLGRGGVVTLYPRIEQILAVIEECFAPLKPDYVIYTREIAAWKRSVHNQAVKTDTYTGTLETLLQDTADCGSWSDLQARISAVVGSGRIHFLALEDERDKTRPGTQMLRLAGVPQSVIDALTPVAGTHNTSLNAGALEFLRRANGEDFPPKARRQLSRLVKQNQALFVDGEGVQA